MFNAKKLLFLLLPLLLLPAQARAGYYGGHAWFYDWHYPRHYYQHDYHVGLGTDAALVVLGILGAAALVAMLGNSYERDRYYSRAYRLPRSKPTYRQFRSPGHAPATVKVQKKPVYDYPDNAGWDRLAMGRSEYAMDIFAIQSQQQPDNGLPRLGFALAAAKQGETARAARAMRRAVRLDAGALDRLPINRKLKTTLAALSADNPPGIPDADPDRAFLLATLFYLQEDYTSARQQLATNDTSDSARALKRLIENQLRQGQAARPGRRTDS